MRHNVPILIKSMFLSLSTRKLNNNKINLCITKWGIGGSNFICFVISRSVRVIQGSLGSVPPGVLYVHPFIPAVIDKIENS